MKVKGTLSSIFVGLVFISAFYSCVNAKECTNIPTGISTGTIEKELKLSKNETWKQEILSKYPTPKIKSKYMDLIPRKLLNRDPSVKVDDLDWKKLYESMNGNYVGVVHNDVNISDYFLKEISLHDVRLDPDSIYGRAQQTNLEYLLMLDVDRLVYSFRNQSGLPTPGVPYGGWEAPDQELRGHFVGHYMSASSLMWASTHNQTLYGKMTAVVDALFECQNKSTGYLSAFPEEFFDRFEALKPVWAPYYTVHKIMAGLLDQHTHVGNARALQMVTRMADYFANRVKNVIQYYSIERHWTSLNDETGGMNDLLYRLYKITGDQKHLTLAHLFDKPCFLGPLALKVDDLSGFHANTHIPVVIGAEMRYEVTGDPLYKEIATFFMHIVNSSHTFATGGTSVDEHWSDPKRLADTLNTEDQESCTTYNMLKVSRNLFKWTKGMGYADHYERALINSLLSIQRGDEPGVMIYMLPQGPGMSKARSLHGWGTQFDSFWCCYGTGIETFSKLGDSIYFEEMGSGPILYITQFIPNSFDWRSGGMKIHQKVEPVHSHDTHLRISIEIDPYELSNKYSTLNVRIPYWTTIEDAVAQLNEMDLTLPNPGKFLTITKQWESNDKLTLHLPITLRTEAIKDERSEYASIQAIFFGPYLLAGFTTQDWDVNTSNSTNIDDYITPVHPAARKQLISLSQKPHQTSHLLSIMNSTLTMSKHIKSGTDGAHHATFRLATSSQKQHSKDLHVTIEPVGLPGMAVVHHGPNSMFKVSGHTKINSVFKVVSALNGNERMVSFESSDLKGCFIGSIGTSVKLMCKGNGVDIGENVSFMMREPMKEYDRISFVAKGARRNFLLEPLFTFRDESYTVYFNME